MYVGRIEWTARASAGDAGSMPLPQCAPPSCGPRAAQAHGAFRSWRAVLLSHLQTKPPLFVSSAVLLEFLLTLSQRPHVF